MTERPRRFRDLFLLPPGETPAVKPTRDDLRRLSRADRRRAKIRYQAASGAFRTWVYVVFLVVLLTAFALYISQFS